jgi:prepilin-type N-terminal cleavage/methylation domain-containing protein
MILFRKLKSVIPSNVLTNHAARAFTLIEMVVVMAIITTLMIAGTSLLSGRGPQSRRTGTDMLCGLIEHARTTAMTTHSEILIAIAEPGDLPGSDGHARIGLFRKIVSTASKSITTVDHYDRISRWQIFQTGVVILGGKPAVTQLDGAQNPMDEPKQEFIDSRQNLKMTMHAISINAGGSVIIPDGSGSIFFRISEGSYRDGKAIPNIPKGMQVTPENLLKIGRVIARPYQIN